MRAWFVQFIARWRLGRRPGTENQDEIARAECLLAAVDRGGIPLNPARVNQIARDLGLEVSRQAPVGDTLQRIRAALLRHRERAAMTDR